MSQKDQEQRDTFLYRFPKLLALRQSLQQAEATDNTVEQNDTSTPGSVIRELAETALYEMTKTCADLFENLVAVLDERVILFSAEWPFDRFVGLRNSFAYWTDFLGVLGPKSISLDKRLEKHAEVKELVWELLAMVDRSITHCKPDRPVFPPSMHVNRMANKQRTSVATLYEARSNSPEEARQMLQAIDSAIERLHFLARTIRRASHREPGKELLGFRSRGDELFHQYAITRVKMLFPYAKKSLWEHIGGFMATRRAALLLTQQHAIGLTAKRDNESSDRTGIQAISPGSHQGSVSTSQNMCETPSQNRIPVPNFASNSKLGLLRPSTMGKSSFKEIYHKQSTISIPSSTFSRQDSKTALEYPTPPPFKDESGKVPCTFCREPLQLSKSDLKNKKNSWTYVIIPTSVNEQNHPRLTNKQ